MRRKTMLVGAAAMLAAEALCGDVFLIGDSIRLGYGPEVKKILEARGDRVYQPDDNCRYSMYTLRLVAEWAKLAPDRSKVEVVHWNNGLWDLGEIAPGECTSPLWIYTNTLERVAAHLRRAFPKAKIVFALTTPINEKVTSEWHTLGNPEVDKYNAAARVALAGKVDAFDDLNAFVRRNGLTEHYKDVVHYDAVAYRRFAEEVVRVIDRTRGGDSSLDE